MLVITDKTETAVWANWRNCCIDWICSDPRFANSHDVSFIVLYFSSIPIDIMSVKSGGTVIGVTLSFMANIFVWCCVFLLWMLCLKSFVWCRSIGGYTNVLGWSRNILFIAKPLHKYQLSCTPKLSFFFPMVCRVVRGVGRRCKLHGKKWKKVFWNLNRRQFGFLPWNCGRRNRGWFHGLNGLGVAELIWKIYLIENEIWIF